MGNIEIGTPVEYPQFRRVGIVVATPIPSVELEWRVNSIPKFANGVGIGIDGIVPNTGQRATLSITYKGITYKGQP